MKGHESYQASNVGWLGDVPKHWDCLKVGNLFFQRKTKVSDKDYPPLSVTKNGVVPQLADAAKSNDGDNRKLVRVGDFVINGRSDRKGSCGVSDFDGSVSLINIVLEPRQERSGRYFHYLLSNQRFSEEFYKWGRGIVDDLWTTRYSEMKNILLPVPPQAEQDQIVRFLDWKTSRINHLINVHKKEIDKLEELKSAIISQTVTRGLNPNAKMKDSGISWLGDIPERWRCMKIKWLFNEAEERNRDCSSELLTFSKKRGLLPFSEASDKKPSASDLSDYKVLHIGQLLENRMQAWHGMFICSDREGCVSPDYSVFNPSTERDVNVKFYEYVFRSDRWVQQFANESRGIGTGFNRLYTPKFGDVHTVYPPIEEQNEIVEFLNGLRNKTDGASEKIKLKISLLKEYKNCLISDVVTGQIDVRYVAIPEYERVEEIADAEIDDETELEEAESETS